MVRPARPAEVPLCADILAATARDRQRRGEPLWPPSALTAEALARQYPPEAFASAGWHSGGGHHDSAGSDPDFWPDAAPGEALYLHKLGVRPEFQGQKLARRMLEAALSEAGSSGCSFLRLDTAWDRPKLRAIYDAFGFEGRGRKTVHGSTWCSTS